MRGNAAIMKCTIPSFVADFVSVVTWIDEDGVEYVPSKGNFSSGKVSQSTLTRNPPPHPRLLLFNFVTCFIICAFKYFTRTVVNQFYDAEITKEYVMRGNSAILKCLIPSFVADFVQVDAWVDEDGEEYVRSSDYTQGRKKFNKSYTALDILLIPQFLLS